MPASLAQALGYAPTEEEEVPPPPPPPPEQQAAPVEQAPPQEAAPQDGQVTYDSYEDMGTTFVPEGGGEPVPADQAITQAEPAPQETTPVEAEPVPAEAGASLAQALGYTTQEQKAAERKAAQGEEEAPAQEEVPAPPPPPPPGPFTQAVEGARGALGAAAEPIMEAAPEPVQNVGAALGQAGSGLADTVTGVTTALGQGDVNTAFTEAVGGLSGPQMQGVTDVTERIQQGLGAIPDSLES